MCLPSINLLTVTFKIHNFVTLEFLSSEGLENVNSSSVFAKHLCLLQGTMLIDRNNTVFVLLRAYS